MKKLVLFSLLVIISFLIISCGDENAFPSQERNLAGQAVANCFEISDSRDDPSVLGEVHRGSTKFFDYCRIVNGVEYVYQYRCEDNTVKSSKVPCSCNEGVCVTDGLEDEPGGFNPRCGNGEQGFEEQCDDGNIIAGDGCSNLCQLEYNLGVGLSCVRDGQCLSHICNNNVCASQRCGNGVVESGEKCDDGNNVDLDTCTNQCLKPQRYVIEGEVVSAYQLRGGSASPFLLNVPVAPWLVSSDYTGLMKFYVNDELSSGLINLDIIQSRLYSGGKLNKHLYGGDQRLDFIEFYLEPFVFSSQSFSNPNAQTYLPEYFDMQFTFKDFCSGGSYNDLGVHLGKFTSAYARQPTHDLFASILVSDGLNVVAGTYPINYGDSITFGPDRLLLTFEEFDFDVNTFSGNLRIKLDCSNV